MGQTKITGHCDGLMCKNGEPNVVDFAYVESCCLFVWGRSSSLFNPTDLCRKLLACLSLHVDMVPMAYHSTPH
jgi:hypothetical protein